MDTHAALEQVFCDLEGAERAFLASSGLGAVTLALFSVLNSGDHVIVADCAYGPVRYLDKTVLSRMNIEVSYSRAGVAELAGQLRPHTSGLDVERVEERGGGKTGVSTGKY